VALTSLATQRDHITKELLREGWTNDDQKQQQEHELAHPEAKAGRSMPATPARRRRQFVTGSIVDAFGRTFLLQPLSLLMRGLPDLDVLRPLWLEHHAASSDHRQQAQLARSAIEYAVERGLGSAVELLLPLARQQCDDSKLHELQQTFETGRLSAVQRALRNDDHAMATMLLSAGIPCLNFDKSSSSTTVHPPQEKPTVVSSHAAADVQPMTPQPAVVGGWRRTTKETVALLQELEKVPTLGCPFPRLPLAELSAARFAELLAANRPVLLTDALGNWSASELLIRSRLEHVWGDKEVQWGRIPYAHLFDSEFGHMSLKEYLRVMDRYAAVAHQSGLAQLSAEAPLYIFDHELPMALRWNETYNGATKRMFEVPDAIRAALQPVQAELPQFFLGPAGSGAPFHLHCPAVNGLVYGRKRWYLHPPAVVSCFLFLCISSEVKRSADSRRSRWS
jgi:hypothetical protein